MVDRGVFGPLLLGVVLAIMSDVRRHHGSALQRHVADKRAWARRDLPFSYQRAVLLGAARRAGQPKLVASLDKHLPGVCLTQTDRVLNHRLEDRLEFEV